MADAGRRALLCQLPQPGQGQKGHVPGLLWWQALLLPVPCLPG